MARHCKTRILKDKLCLSGKYDSEFGFVFDTMFESQFVTYYAL